jgi:apyrase
MGMPLVALLIAAVGAYENDADDGFGIVIDAGSGGSRIHVYRWSARVGDPMFPDYPAVSVPREVGEPMKVRPGLSDFKDKVKDIGAYLEPLFKHAVKIIDGAANSHATHPRIVPIYLKCTAGMRDLYSGDRDAILEETRRVLAASPFRFENDYWAIVMSGEEEGVFGWLSVNLNLGTYRLKNKETLGALDMGGASTEITFIPQSHSIIQNIFPVKIGAYSLHLYSHSYLEFGYRDAYLRLTKELPPPTHPGGRLHHPCFPKGVTWKQTLGSPFEPEPTVVSVVGAWDMEECRASMKKLMHLDDACFFTGKGYSPGNRDGECAISGVYQPRVMDSKFVASGAYANVAKQLDLGNHATVEDFHVAVERRCADNPAPKELAFDGPDVTKGPQGLCHVALWADSVLRFGHKLGPDTRLIFHLEDLPKGAIGWALGSMAYDSNFYPWTSVSGSSLLALPKNKADFGIALPALAGGLALGALLMRVFGGERKLVADAPSLYQHLAP